MTKSADRVDALGAARSERLQELRGAVLDTGDDPELQQIVTEVAALLQVPIALVSLILEKTQFFRAQVGLPAELAETRATDRDLSFCQFVVRDDAPLEVQDATESPALPKDLVDRYGIRAYLGEPIRIDGVVVGSLCGIDVRPRDFDDTQRKALAELAKRASARLGVLARQTRHTGHDLLEAAAAPVFAEMRNLMTTICANAVAAKVLLADARPVQKMAMNDHKAAPVLVKAVEALEELWEVARDLEDASLELAADLEAVERLLIGSAGGSTLTEIVENSTRLAHHELKLVDGVHWSPYEGDVRIGLPRVVISAAVASMLAGLAVASGRELTARVRVDGRHVRFRITAPSLSEAELEFQRMAVEALLDGYPMVSITAGAGAITLQVPRALGGVNRPPEPNERTR